MAEIVEIQNRVRMREQMLENAQSAQQEALRQHYDQAVTAERAKVVADAESVLRQERLQQQELVRNMEQSQANAEERIRNAQEIIQGLERTIQDQTQSVKNTTTTVTLFE